eukprot:TRINITY_DN5538_c0_g1_i2.p1 TRINITY_DN5538_c0_g1~~TRINITY_DN5538_c0_g1_i2.p1  ORF type:complete len:757 (-),score=161.92 TRINITY_DN5538_c0_g1_i2:48-2318(-)
MDKMSKVAWHRLNSSKMQMPERLVVDRRRGQARMGGQAADWREVLPEKEMFVPVIQGTRRNRFFVGREWLWARMERHVIMPDCVGVVVNGSARTGKTSILKQFVCQLVEMQAASAETVAERKKRVGAEKCAAKDRQGVPAVVGSPAEASEAVENSKLTKLKYKVLCYHFGQSCPQGYHDQPGWWVRNLAAQTAEVLRPYRVALSHSWTATRALQPEESNNNPIGSLVVGVLDILATLEAPPMLHFMVIDCDEGFDVSEFLVRAVSRFPSWLKLILTTTPTELAMATAAVQGNRGAWEAIELDSSEQHITQDMVQYAHQQLERHSKDTANATESAKLSRAPSDELRTLCQRSRGNYAYVSAAIELIVASGALDLTQGPSLSRYIQTACGGEMTGACLGLLHVLLAARRPLTATELAQSLGLSSPGELAADTESKVRLLTNELGPLVAWGPDGCWWANTWMPDWLRDFYKTQDGTILSEAVGHKKLASSLLRSGSKLETSVQRWLLQDEDAEDETALATAVDDHELVYEVVFHLARSRCGTVGIQAEALAASMEDRLEAARRTDGATALHRTCNKGHCEMADVLLHAKANPDAVARDGSTSCYAAAKKGHSELVELLLLWGADPCVAVGTSERTALIVATEKGHRECVVSLLAANIEDRAAQSNTALRVAVAKGRHQLIELLCEAKADPCAVHEHGHTALHIAARGGYTRCVSALLDAGAGDALEMLDDAGLTPLKAATLNPVSYTHLTLPTKRIVEI